ncbi:hypothetical protein PV327_008164, partial [Microctonus hyperodae]
MASIARFTKQIFSLSKSVRNRATDYTRKNYRHSIHQIIKTATGIIAIGFTGFYVTNKYIKGNVVHAARPRKRDDELQKAIKLTMREKRFIKFASVEYDGQLYMTPQDFLDSVVDSEPRPRHKRRILSEQELEVMRNATPSLKHGN